MLTVKNITKTYGKRNILQNIDLSFHESKVTGLVGRNGIGKTTLLEIIVGLKMTDNKNGSVILEKIELNRFPVHNRIKAGLGYLSQKSSAITDLTVEDNLYLIPKKSINDKTLILLTGFSPLIFPV